MEIPRNKLELTLKMLKCWKTSAFPHLHSLSHTTLGAPLRSRRGRVPSRAEPCTECLSQEQQGSPLKINAAVPAKSS